jgi:signal transduction histidine kinase/purine-cytosine permease-like protein/ActR/RegA family two-component response regulator
MNVPQRVIRQRRQYNQWVGNQTLEDFALRFTARKARRSAFTVGNTALGAVSFLACEAIGGSITLSFGFANAMAAILAAGAIMFLVGLPICAAATRHGVDVDLLTRGAGFGYIGSTITSLIYATFTFILFSIEASIMSAAIVQVLHLPLWLANVCAAAVVVPIAVLGIRAISRMQLFTQPVWLMLQFGPLLYLAAVGLPDFSAWTQFTGSAGATGIALLPFGTATSILLSLLPQIGEQVDYLRFLPARAETGRIKWWGTMLFAGPGWVVTGCAKLAAGSFLTYLAVERGVDWDQAAQPATMFRIAYLEVFHNPALASALMLLFVVTCQIKINTTNAYAGSIAWSNFFSRLTHAHPGRVVWVLFNVALALLLMQLGIYNVIQNILGLYANFAVGWMGALAADLVINKSLGLSPPGIEFKRAHLYDINPVGLGAMGISVLVSTLMSFGVFGEVARALAPFAGLVVAFCAAPAIAFATRGKFYLARQPEPAAARSCIVCEGSFEAPDMASCPAYGGFICSLCCTLEARCRDLCKPRGRFSAQMTDALSPRLAGWAKAHMDARIFPFLGFLLVFTALIAGLLGLICYEYDTLVPTAAPVVKNTLLVVFFPLFIMAALAAWLLVLAHASRRAAEAETGHQTTMLLDEIGAHQRTDAALQKAKAAAESANTAKSRYIVGVIHEIRAPLNAIFGYAQLLESGGTLRPEDAIRTIRRSAAHLSNLVDGLLDISQIETGALHLHRDQVDFTEFLDQIADMFRLQAAAKGIEFRDERSKNLPRFIYTDEKRLRQILINLLSNAIKYTAQGSATLRVSKRGQVTELAVIDTGHGIRPEDRQKIFEPFERGHLPAANAVPGTGLGLTITKLLTEILGGEISLESEPGQGSLFRVRLLLSEAPAAGSKNPARRITAYAGTRRKILIADDDADHVRLITDMLLPLGFIVLAAADGLSCLAMVEDATPDLIILDIAMPGMSGLEVAAELRTRGADAKILMVSGNLHDATPQGAADYDGFLAKPIDLRALLERIGTLLALDWVQERPATILPTIMVVPGTPHLAELLQLSRIGYVRGIEAKLSALEQDQEYAPFCAQLRGWVRGFELQKLTQYLEALHP